MRGRQRDGSAGQGDAGQPRRGGRPAHPEAPGRDPRGVQGQGHLRLHGLAVPRRQPARGGPLLGRRPLVPALALARLRLGRPRPVAPPQVVYLDPGWFGPSKRPGHSDPWTLGYLDPRTLCFSHGVRGSFFYFQIFFGILKIDFTVTALATAYARKVSPFHFSECDRPRLIAEQK